MDVHDRPGAADGESGVRPAEPEPLADWQRLVDAMPYIVLAVNERGEVTHHNRAWFAYTGLTRERSRGDGWLALLHADDRKRRSASWSSARAAGEPFTMELRIRRAADTTYRWFLAHVAPVRDATEELEYWVESYVDIDTFRVSRELCDVLDHLGHMVAVRNADESVAFVSPSWVRFSGGVAASSTSRERRDFVHPDDVRLVEEIVRTSHSAPLELQQNEVRVRSQDGSYRWFLSRSIVLPETSDAPKRRLNTLTDIEDLKRAQATLTASAADFSHKANHDPLTNLLNRRGFVDRLTRMLDEAGEAHTRVVVFYLDVDHFKSINDTFGHDAGDAFLRTVARAFTRRCGAPISRAGSVAMSSSWHVRSSTSRTSGESSNASRRPSGSPWKSRPEP